MNLTQRLESALGLGSQLEGVRTFKILNRQGIRLGMNGFSIAMSAVCQALVKESCKEISDFAFVVFNFVLHRIGKTFGFVFSHEYLVNSDPI